MFVNNYKCLVSVNGDNCLMSVSGLQVQLMLTYLIAHTVTKWNMAGGRPGTTTFKTTSRNEGGGGDGVGKTSCVSNCVFQSSVHNSVCP